MFAIVRGVINTTFGLFSSKLRRYTAGKLDEGDLTDAQLKSLIVRELDDIKSKLDGLSRKDLLGSLSFFKEGFTRLNMSLEISHESCDEPSTSNTAIQDKSKVEGATTAAKVEHIPPRQTERDELEDVFKLSEFFGNLNVTSQDRYNLAKDSFKEARRLATEAFSNVALSLGDRLMAGKLRIASRILEGLDDLEAAVGDCLNYLRELQDLSAIQKMVSVWHNPQKGITSRVRALFNKEERNDNIQSIQLTNALLFDLTVKFTKITMALFSWPTIMIGTTFYHPLLEDREISRKIKEEKAPRPWISKFDKRIGIDTHCALTSKGEILSITRKDLKIIRRSGKCDTFWLIPSEEDEKIQNEILCVAVDDNDNVYMVIEVKTRCSKYKLIILDANGNAKAERFIEIISESWLTQMNVTKDGMVVILADNVTPTLYICDSANAKRDNKLPLLFKKRMSYQLRFDVSKNNEIIFIESWVFTTDQNNMPEFLNMYITTMDGELRQSVRLPFKATINGYWFCRANVVVNHVNETILVSFYDRPSSAQTQSQTTIFTLSKTGEILHQFEIRGMYPMLISQPNGPIALIKSNHTIMLQM